MSRPRPWIHVETQLLPDCRAYRALVLAALHSLDPHEEGAP